MKRISLFLIVAVFSTFTACTNDQATDFNTDARSGFKQKSIDGLDELYADMIISQEYIDSQAANMAFMDKVNFTGDISILDDEIEFLRWISNNLSGTSFNSFVEVETEWDNVKGLAATAFQKHLGFYRGIGENPGRLKDIIPIGEDPITGFDCKQCKLDYKKCNDDATTTYADSVEKTMNKFNSGQVTGKQASNDINKAGIQQELSKQLCKDAFLECCVNN